MPTAPSASVAAIVKVTGVPLEVDGVPVMAPEVLLMVRPEGRLPTVTE